MRGLVGQDCCSLCDHLRADATFDQAGREALPRCRVDHLRDSELIENVEDAIPFAVIGARWVRTVFHRRTVEWVVAQAKSGQPNVWAGFKI